MTNPIERKWVPYSQAAKFYVGISPEILLGAIKRGELPAYEKPITRGRRQDATSEYHSYFVNLGDVDTYIRTYWQQAFEQPMTSAPSAG